MILPCKYKAPPNIKPGVGLCIWVEIWGIFGVNFDATFGLKKSDKRPRGQSSTLSSEGENPYHTLSPNSRRKMVIKTWKGINTDKF